MMLPLNLRRNVGHKQMVEVGFRSFAQFARILRGRHVHLLVVEGQIHPNARQAYDTDGQLQEATRARLGRMARELDFTFVAAHEMPPFTTADFKDAYHLNATGRAKLTDFVTDLLPADH